ncbi:MAG: endolytic transglycosylase MltG [Alphaproteobacteria bacterium]
MKRLAAALLGLALGLVLMAGAGVWWGNQRYAAPGPLSKPVTVVIPKGAGRNAIMRRLLAARVIEDPMLFRIAMRVTGTGARLKAGEYRFAARISMARVIERMVVGKTILRRFVAFEGKTTFEILARLRATKGLRDDIGEPPGEGELLPETYSFSLGDKRAALVARMREAMRKTLDELWEKRAPDLPFKTKRQALILASIVEKETGRASERARVAAVFVNRLRKKMRLQTDPTVIYGITKGKGPLGRPLLKRDLAARTAYNTYLIDGLPPGPIANPGRAAIAAALNPQKTDELFFVADGTGGHAFAKTLAEHNRNVRRWREIERKRRQEQKKNREQKKKKAGQ